MSMLSSGSVIISGGSLVKRESALLQIIDAPKIFDEIEKLIQNGQIEALTQDTLPKNNPDIVVISSKDQKIGIDDVRELLSRLTIKPINRQQKIGIVLEAEKLTPEAQNALLKTLEEPPDSCLIILSIPNFKNLLPTILSRCLTINLGDNHETAANLDNPHLASLSVGSKFALAQKVGSSRQLALDFLDSLSQQLHLEILANQKLSTGLFQKLQAARRIILANGNPRLTLENLFLDW